MDTQTPQNKKLRHARFVSEIFSTNSNFHTSCLVYWEVFRSFFVVVDFCVVVVVVVFLGGEPKYSYKIILNPSFPISPNTDLFTLKYRRLRVQSNFSRVFSVFSHRPGRGAAILAVCRRFGNRRLHYARFRFVSRQEHLFPHCFGTFSVNSFPCCSQ